MKPMSLLTVLGAEGFIEIPLRMTASGLIEVDVRVNGEPGLLVLDTGAGATVFDAASAARLHLDLNQTEATGAGLGSGSHPAQASLVNDLTIGSLHLASLETLVMDLSHLNEARARKGMVACDGILGADILGGRSAVIDYGSQNLYLRSAP